jgi:Taurine catabolism dioxygenase TauD, TfdA family
LSTSLITPLVGHDRSLEQCAREVESWLESREPGDDPALFRGYDMGEAGDLARIFDLVGLEPLSYVGGNSPRTQLGGNVYTSTEYSASATITLHQELSYERDFPDLLFFLCGIPATTGGLTPWCDSRQLLESLPDAVTRALDEKGLRYIQRLPARDGLGKSWRATFETDDKAVCEQILRERALEYEWEPDDTLVIIRDRDAFSTHRRSGRRIWFNQADQWHPSALGDERMRQVIERLGNGRYPHDVTYGDGEAIPAEFIATISKTSRSIAHEEPWQRGDLLVLDNETTLHGRDSFAGPRKIFVSMARDRWMPRETGTG